MQEIDLYKLKSGILSDCDGEVQGEFALKMTGCIDCEFYRLVTHEEGLNFQSAKEILDRLK